MLTPTRTLPLAVAVLALIGCAPDGPAGPLAGPALARAAWSGWSPAQPIEQFPGAAASFNTAALEGCPFPARDGRTLFIASDRPGGKGGIDIYVSTRESESDPWGEPVNVGEPVNSAANDFCPTLARDGRTFFFVSNRPGYCGNMQNDDIYVTQLVAGNIAVVRNDDGVLQPGEALFETPQHLDCTVNSVGNEASPVPFPQPGAGPVLYFSSTRAGGPGPEAPGALVGDADLYVSASHGGPGGPFAPAALVPEVNSAAAEGQPNPSRDALELYFFSNRTALIIPNGIPGETTTLGGNDIFVATRTHPSGDWSTPMNLGPNVNGPAQETRPSLSWDGTMLYFGSTRATGEGSTDVYVTTRRRLGGG